MSGSNQPDGSHCLSDGYEIFWATPEVAVGAMPCKPEHLDLLKEEGLGAVLNLCAEFCDLPDIERDHGLAVRYLPIDDMGVPDPVETDKALDWLDAQLARGVKVFMHCRFGMGRTGTVLACWLARRGICLNPGPGWRASPASPEQRRFVKAYLERLGIAPPRHDLWERIMHCLFGH
ncbi:MAG: protein-tyrosine phosphatase family protein [Thermodesulfobacteriota bacterium]